MYIDAAQRKRAKRLAKGGGKNGGKTGGKNPKKKKHRKGGGKPGAAGEPADPNAAAADPTTGGEDAWTGEGVEFETIEVDASGNPIEVDE